MSAGGQTHPHMSYNLPSDHATVSMVQLQAFPSMLPSHSNQRMTGAKPHHHWPTGLLMQGHARHERSILAPGNLCKHGSRPIHILICIRSK